MSRHLSTLGLVGAVLTLACEASVCFAGLNSGGTALLSWDRAGHVIDLHALPDTTLTLYLWVPDILAPDFRIFWHRPWEWSGDVALHS